MPATMSEIAKAAGVSVAVVSRFLRGDPELRISPQRRQEILAVKDQLGGIKFRKKRARLTKTILVPANRIFTPQYIQANTVGMGMTHGVESTLKEKGFRLHYTFFEPNGEYETLSGLIRSRTDCDGVVLLSGFVNDAVADLLRSHEFPHVALDQAAERFHVNTVWTHTSGGIRQAVEHLYQLGHRKIGYVGVRGFYRYPLVVAALTAMELPVDESLNCYISPIATNEDLHRWIDVTREAFSQWLAQGPKATALICQNDLFAWGVTEAMRATGLEPGRDLSFVGYDNIEQRGSDPVAEPYLTTVDNPTDQMGRRAAQLLLNQILHGQTEIVHERIPIHLIVRQTTGPCRPSELRLQTET